jgi:hypothetical protein
MEIQRKPIVAVGVPAEILTEQLPNTSLECYCYNRTLCRFFLNTSAVVLRAEEDNSQSYFLP